MTDDRELLELAAKAAGIVVHTVEDGDGVVHWMGWNPLTDDGDALRLAVKLQIDIFFDLPAITVFGPSVQITGDAENDPMTATRRAIVRAAAEIGRAMPAAKAGKGGDHD